jgi:solute carrier family 20 (sodium-dependent phosphate transporter)
MFTWVLVVGSFAAFYNAWGIGADDCANSFATSRAAGVLTLEQAVIVAGIFESAGAISMGSRVSKTIRKKIVNVNVFKSSPGALMLGMMCSNLAAGIWLQIATYLKLPVSTTHSIIGAIIGFSLIYDGKDSVTWGFKEAGEGKMEGFFKIMMSWFISPVAAGLICLFLYSIFKNGVLKSPNSYERTLKIFPLLTFITFFMNTFFIIFKGSPQLKLDEAPEWTAWLSASIIGLTTAGLAWFVYVPYKRRRITASENGEDVENNKIVNWLNSLNCLERKNNNENVDVENIELENLTHDEKIKKINNTKNRIKDIKKAENIENLHGNAIETDHKVEMLCASLQVITACFSAFAHGANDVANSIGPYATVLSIHNEGEVDKKNDVPIWILIMGGVGIALGLATWGYKLIDRIGTELTKVTASRGFIIEFSAALTVLIASVLEIPVSTTHCQIGAVIGCGMGDGIMKNVEWKLAKEIVLSWLITVPAAGFISAILFSFLIRLDNFE